MTYDGTDYQPEQRLEERALRYADAYFTDGSKWAKGHFNNGNGGICIMEAMFRFRHEIGISVVSTFEMTTSALDIAGCPINWNDSICPDFAALKAKLHERILFYQKQRLSQSYIVVIGPGRQVGV